MNRTQRMFFALVALAALFISARVGTTLAAPVIPVEVAGATGPVPPEANRFHNVLDAQGMQEAVDLAEQIAPYLYVGKDGLVALKDATASEIGVSEQFLANYRIALQESNKLIARGDISVAPDMKVTVNRTVAPTVGGVPGLPGGATTDAAASPETAVPEWGAWSYSSGAMFYNSYSTYTSYRYNYYNLCNSMASYINYPWMSSSLVNFYSYNQSYLNSYCYNPTGTYYYMPYQSGCSGSYSPCYGNLGYKPAYFWTRSYAYNNSCNCNTYNWQWQGYWTRY